MIVTIINISSDGNEALAKVTGRIDSSCSAEFEEKLFAGIGESKNIILDFNELDYISSAGLRVLLKLKKSDNRNISVINVSSEVYEIFEVTGFDTFFDIKRRRRRLSAEGCTEIARGAMGIIYRLDEETILKVYDKSLSLDALYTAQETLKKLFINDIPCAIPFDIVDVEDTHGAVYEMLQADTLAQYIMKNPSEVEIIATRAAELLKEMHQRELPEGLVGNAKDILREWFDSAKPYLNKEEQVELSSIIESFKDAKTFLHLDFHTKNVMIRNGELVIIDLDDACAGDPMIDIACLMMSMCNKEFSNEDCLHFVGMTRELTDKYIKKFFEVYFSTTDNSQIESVLAKLRPITGLRTVYARVHRVGLTDSERKEKVEAGIAYIRKTLKHM